MNAPNPKRPLQLPRTPTAVVFDLDGTLIDSERLVRGAYFDQCAAFGVAFSEADFLSLVGLHREANDQRLLQLFGADFPLAHFYAGITAQIGDSVAPMKPGALALLERVSDMGLPVALATSSGPGWVDRHFRAHALSDHFRAIVTRDDVTNRKPHPEPYLKAAQHLEREPSVVLAVEDSPTGFRSAHAAGMMTILAPDMIAPDAELSALAHGVVETLHEVVELLRQT